MICVLLVRVRGSAGQRLTKWVVDLRGLVLQDAARKRRKASQHPGAWAGTVIHTDGEEVCVLVSQEKWDKTRRWISWMKEHTDAKQKFCHKEL